MCKQPSKLRKSDQKVTTYTKRRKVRNAIEPEDNDVMVVINLGSWSPRTVTATPRRITHPALE